MKYILIVLLIATVTALKNIPIPTNTKPGQYLGEIESIRILPEEILFMLKDNSKFVYLDKNQGNPNMVVEIQDSQRVMEFNNQEIQILQKSRMKAFNIHNKTLWIQRPLKNIKGYDFSEIVGYLNSRPQWLYILTDKNIVRVPFEPQKKTYIQNIYNKTTQNSKTQTFKQLIRVIDIDQASSKNRKQQKYLLISQISQKSNKQICLKMFQGKKSTQTSCFQVDKSSQYQMGKFKVNLFYISMSDATYVVDLGLKVKSRIDKKLVSLSEHVLVLEGGASFMAARGSVSEELVFQSQQNHIYKLLVQDDKISLVQSSQLKKKPIAELQRLNKLKPINCWMDQIGKQKSSQYELLIQWDDLSISFVHVKDDDVKSVWRIEKVEQ